MSTKPVPPICIHCAHYVTSGASGYLVTAQCRRPIAHSEEVNLVTGALKEPTCLHDFAARQRSPLSFWEKLRGVVRCGPEGRFFVAKD